MMHTVFKRMVVISPPPFIRETMEQVEKYEVAFVSADPNADPITILEDIESFEGACAIASHLNGGAAPGIGERMVTALQSVETQLSTIESAIRGVEGSIDCVGTVLGTEDGDDDWYSIRRQLAVMSEKLVTIANVMPD